jgi:3-oxoacyl-[acyl-carrier-protein] synthase-3
MTREPAPIGLSGVAGVLPPRFRVLSDLAGDGLLTSAPEVLSGFGFDRAYVCDESCTVEHMARAAAQLALADAGLHSQQIDLLIWASARAENHVCASPAAGDGRGSLLDGFRYSSAWLQHALELDHADVMAVAQQGCSTMFSALRVAQALLTAHPGRQHVLCVAADALPRGSHREILYNVISDAACAVVVSRGSMAERWVGCRQLSKGGYWDPSSCGPEIIASYFPTARAVIAQLLDDHCVDAADVDVVVPTGVNRASWEILIRLLGIPSDRIYQSLPSFGHTLTSDTFLFLQALRREKRLRPGAKVLLFTYGFGSSWSAILLEH